MKKCAASSASGEMRVKAVREHYVPVRMAKTKNTVMRPKADENTKKFYFSYIPGGKLKWYNHSKNSLEVVVFSWEAFSLFFLQPHVNFYFMMKS